MRKEAKSLTYITIAFILISILSSLAIAKTTITKPIIFSLAILIPSVYLLIKFKNEPNSKDLIISLILANAGGLYGMVRADYFSGPLVIGMVMSGYMGAVSVFRKYVLGNKIIRTNYIKSIGLGVILGLVLGYINIKLAGISNNPVLTPDAIAMALYAGIWEEVGIRFILYALAIYILKGEAKTKYEKFLIYTIMVAPHVLAHGIMRLDSFVCLILLFGLPMSILQRKVDLTSAIIVHTLVDLIRFVYLGI
ncbi:type II CAAX prenyl endopeptidase Rce1 family protein [Anaerococcus nagyae]|uniref:CPBP family glutamic-type intramembrane protease n=2 Tax=Anaerococcus nagyae TaxID=1755241 RepID=UPI003736A7AB